MLHFSLSFRIYHLGRKHNIWKLDETQLESCAYTHIVKWHPAFPMRLSNLGEIGVGLWVTQEKCQFYFSAIFFFLEDSIETIFKFLI